MTVVSAPSTARTLNVSLSRRLTTPVIFVFSPAATLTGRALDAFWAAARPDVSVSKRARANSPAADFGFFISGSPFLEHLDEIVFRSWPFGRQTHCSTDRSHPGFDRSGIFLMNVVDSCCKP